MPVPGPRPDDDDGDEGLRHFHVKNHLGKTPSQIYFSAASQNGRSRTDHCWRRRTKATKGP